MTDFLSTSNKAEKKKDFPVCFDEIDCEEGHSSLFMQSFFLGRFLGEGNSKLFNSFLQKYNA